MATQVHADEQRRHQRDAPLQGKPLHFRPSHHIALADAVADRVVAQRARSFLRSAEICTRMELLKLSTLLSQTCSISSS